MKSNLMIKAKMNEKSPTDLENLSGLSISLPHSNFYIRRGVQFALPSVR